MNMGSPRFSFVIPVYNAEYYIHRCLDSIVSQTYTDYEVIIVNDGSKDATLSVLESYSKFFSKDRFMIFSQNNSGAGAARNFGIEKTTGEYIVFIDSDDYIDTDYLEQINSKIINEDSDIVFIDLIRETPEGHVIRKEPMSRFQSLDKNAMIRAQLTGKMPWGGVRKIYKASIIKDHQLRYAPIKVGEESIFSFRALEEAKVISFQPRAIYHYVDTGTSLTSKDEVSNSVIVFNYMYSYLKDSGKLALYEDTVGSMAVTTVAIIVNLLSKKSVTRETINEAQEKVAEFAPYYAGKIDKESLDARVRFCFPFIKEGRIKTLLFTLSWFHKLFH